MADLIATEGDAVAKSGSTASYTSNKCCTKTRANDLGCTTKAGTTYADNQLVTLGDLEMKSMEQYKCCGIGYRMAAVPSANPTLLATRYFYPETEIGHCSQYNQSAYVYSPGSKYSSNKGGVVMGTNASGSVIVAMTTKTLYYTTSHTGTWTKVMDIPNYGTDYMCSFFTPIIWCDSSNVFTIAYAVTGSGSSTTCTLKYLTFNATTFAGGSGTFSGSGASITLSSRTEYVYNVTSSSGAGPEYKTVGANVQDGYENWDYPGARTVSPLGVTIIKVHRGDEYLERYFRCVIVDMANKKCSAELNLTRCTYADWGNAEAILEQQPQWVNDGSTYGGFVIHVRQGLYNNSTNPCVYKYWIDASPVTTAGASRTYSDITSRFTASFGASGTNDSIYIASQRNSNLCVFLNRSNKKLYYGNFTTSSITNLHELGTITSAYNPVRAIITPDGKYAIGMGSEKTFAFNISTGAQLENDSTYQSLSGNPVEGTPHLPVMLPPI